MEDDMEDDNAIEKYYNSLNLIEKLCLNRVGKWYDKPLSYVLKKIEDKKLKDYLKKTNNIELIKQLKL